MTKCHSREFGIGQKRVIHATRRASMNRWRRGGVENPEVMALILPLLKKRKSLPRQLDD
jgi:hypothetical protein